MDWGGWEGMHVRGAGAAGDNGISGSRSATSIVADPTANLHVAHDFTGSGYGIVENIAFVGGAEVMVLNGRTTDSEYGCIYGSDIVWRGCNFAGGSRAAFANHMGEVLTWEGCRFHAGGGAPALLLTYQAGAGPWNIRPPSGRTLTAGISLTQFRIFGGEFTGDNTNLIVLDMDNVSASAGDFCSFGAYFASSGNNLAAVNVRGNWENVILDGSRDEETDLPPAGQQVRGFVKLGGGAAGTARLSDFRIHAYSDGDEGGSVVRGTGSLRGGEILSGGGGGIDIDGNVSAVSLRTARGRGAVLKATGDCQDVTLHASATWRHPPTIECGGAMSVEVGGSGGGSIVKYRRLNATHAGPEGVARLVWNITESGLFEASYAGDRLLVHASNVAGHGVFASAVHQLNIQELSGVATLGKLRLAKASPGAGAGAGQPFVEATFQGTDGVFIVRRMAADQLGMWT